MKKFVCKANFAFGGKSYNVGDEFNSNGIVALLQSDLAEKGLIEEVTTKKEKSKDA